MNAARKNLWMSEHDLIDLESKGHVIGLHSYSHPMQMSKLSKTEQLLEYQKNYEHLTELIGRPIKAMSHPCGDYSACTLTILEGMKMISVFGLICQLKKIVLHLKFPEKTMQISSGKCSNESHHF